MMIKTIQNYENKVDELYKEKKAKKKLEQENQL